MTRVGAAIVAEAVVERLHRALPGAAQARGEARRVGCAGGSARRRARGPAAARRGSRRRARAPTRRRTPSIPSRSSRRGACLVGGRAGGALGRIGDPGGRALEDEPARPTPGARRRAAARSGRPASSRGRAPAPASRRRRIVARSSAVRSTLARRRVGAGCRTGRGRAGPRRSRGTPRRTRWRARPSADPRPVNPWSSRSGSPDAARRGPPSGGRPTSTPLMAGVSAAATRRGDLAMQLDVPGTVGPQRRTWTPGGRSSSASASRRSRRRRRRAILAAERRHDRPDVDAVGRPEQLLVVLGQADVRARRRCACGRNEKIPPPSLSTRTIVADRPWSRAATSALRSWRNDTSPTTSATGPTGRGGGAQGRRDDAVDAVGARGSQRTGWRGRSPAARRPCRGPACELPAHSSAPSGSAAASAANGAPSNGSSSARRQPASPCALGRAARSAATSRGAHARRRARRRTRRSASRAASASAVAAASAWTNVVGESAGSLQPRVAVDHDLARARVRASSSSDRLRGRRRPEADDEVGHDARRATGPGAYELVRARDDQATGRGRRSGGRTAGRRGSESRSRRRGARGPRGAPGRRPARRR